MGRAMLYRCAAVAVSLLLCGCADYYAGQNAARLEGHRSQCQAYGLQYGTPAFANCMQNLDNQDATTRAALAGAYLNRPQPQPYVLPMPAQSVPRTCTSIVSGQMITTNCN
jgi:hypothetical protein